MIFSFLTSSGTTPITPLPTVLTYALPLVLIIIFSSLFAFALIYLGYLFICSGIRENNDFLIIAGIIVAGVFFGLIIWFICSQNHINRERNRERNREKKDSSTEVKNS